MPPSTLFFDAPNSTSSFDVLDSTPFASCVDALQRAHDEESYVTV